MTGTIEITQLDVGKLTPSPHNPRRELGAVDLAELAESIKQLGVLEPILARKSGNGFEILAGHRRHAAAKLAKLLTIPTIVRDVDDKTAIEITVTENLQREQLSPLEEAKGLASLKTAGWDAETMAAELGKSAKWVARRLSLLNLAPAITKALNEGGVLKLKGRYRTDELRPDMWPARTLEMLASVEPDTQTLLLAEIVNRERSEVILPEHVREAQKRTLHVLSAAPFDKADPTLNPKQGACTACDLRVSCRKSLFDDAPEAEDGKIPRNDRCLNPECFQSKLDEHSKRAVAQAKKEHDKVRVVADDWSIRQRHKNVDAPAAVGKDFWNEYGLAKKGDKGAIYEFDIGTGKGRYIKKRSGSARAGGKAKAGPTPLKVRRHELEQRRLAWCIGRILEHVETRDTFPPEGAWGDLFTQLLAGAVFGVRPDGLSAGENIRVPGAKGREESIDPWSLLSKVADSDLGELATSADGLRLQRRLFDKLESVLNGRIRLSGNSFRALNVETSSRECMLVCEVFALDWNDLKLQAVEELPEPAGWAKLNADGTPKKTASTKGKSAKKSKSATKAKSAAKKKSSKKAKRK